MVLAAAVVAAFAVVGVVLALVGLGSVVVVVVVVAVLVAVAAVAAAYLRSDAVALSLLGARPADPTAHARLHNVVAGLCLSAGLPVPDLAVIDEPAANAVAVGRDPRHATIAVTTGLLERLDRVELEAVLAHELSRIKSYDTLGATLAVVVPGARAVPGDVEAADLSAVALTRYPPGLIRALGKMAGSATGPLPGPRQTAQLWFDRGAGARPTAEQRIATLREL